LTSRARADAGYDSKENRKAVKRARAEPVIAVNPRSWLALNKFKTVIMTM